MLCKRGLLWIFSEAFATDLFYAVLVAECISDTDLWQADFTKNIMSARKTVGLRELHMTLHDWWHWDNMSV